MALGASFPVHGDVDPGMGPQMQVQVQVQVQARGRVQEWALVRVETWVRVGVAGGH